MAEPATTGGDPAPQPTGQPSAIIDYKALAIAMREQGFAPAQAASPAEPAAPPSPSHPAPNANGRITIDKATLDRYMEAERKMSEAESTAQKNAEELALKRGEYDTVIKAREKEANEAKAKLQAEEKRFRGATRDRELSLALAGKPLVPGAAEQLMKLWRDDFEAHPDGEGYRVLTREGYQPVADEVAKRLAEANNSHFILPTSRGGTSNPAGGQGTTPTPAANAAPAKPAFTNLGEAIIDAYKNVNQKRIGAFGPSGLRPTR